MCYISAQIKLGRVRCLHPKLIEQRNLLVEALDDFMQPFGYIRKIGNVTWSGNTASVSAAATGPSASVRGELARIENLALEYGLVVTKQIPTIQVWEAEQ